MNETARFLSLLEQSLADALEFAGDQSYVVASTTAISQFKRRYNPLAEPGLLKFKGMNIRVSEEQSFKAKHGVELRYHNIATDSLTVYGPPPMGSLNVGSMEEVDRVIAAILAGEDDLVRARRAPVEAPETE